MRGQWALDLLREAEVNRIRIRTGKVRKHTEGYALTIYRDVLTPAGVVVDSIKLGEVYGGSEDDTSSRAQVAAAAFGDFFCAEVRS
jgi:hypothetical protein